MRLREKRILITGGVSGIGQAIARRAVEEAARRSYNRAPRGAEEGRHGWHESCGRSWASQLVPGN